MLNYHSAIHSHAIQNFDMYDWAKLKNRRFCHLIPFDVLLTSKGKISAAREHKIISFIEKQKEILPDSLMMLDCGAFSAYRQGFEIDLDSFITFVKRHLHLWETIVGLDKIGRSKETAERTWLNYNIMRDAGLDMVLPIYHLGEPEEYLPRYCAVAEYVGISPPSGLVGDVAIDVYHAQMYNYDGSLRFPDTKFHGFGVGSPVFFQVYPWYSCDSSNAALYARYGAVLLFEFIGEILKMKQVFVSERQKHQIKHFDNNASSKEIISQMFLDLGFEMADFDESLMSDEVTNKVALTYANRVMFNMLSLNSTVDKIMTGEIALLPSPIRLL